MIEFANVCYSYDKQTPILKGLSCRIEEGDFVAFVGTNGAGKSTTMRLINGLIQPDSGQVLLDGVPVGSYKTSELAKRVGFLFQNPDSQICCNSVRDELAFGFKAVGEYDDSAAARVDAIMEQFGLCGDDDPFLLNRGARQLLALASIVVLEQPIVVLDEPTTGLDYRECMQVMDIIRNLHRSGTTVVMVCHDMEVVADYAQRVVVVDDGRVLESGPTFEVLRNSALLAEANLVPPQIAGISMELARAAADANVALSEALLGANTIDEMCAAVAACKGVAYTGPTGPEAAVPSSLAPGAERNVEGGC